jgi:internalin A
MFDIEVTELDLSGLQLHNVPGPVRDLTKLTWLNLQNNPLHTLPLWLGSMKNLRTVELPQQHDECITNVPSAVFQKGWKSVQSYLLNLNSGVSVYRTKLLVVGQHQVGKTSLVRSLCGLKVREKEPTTDGIQICREVLKVKVKTSSELFSSTNIKLVLWDFGGQPVYYDTHHFFLTGSSIILVVWDVRDSLDESKVQYWLEAIRARAGKLTPVVLVGTHIDALGGGEQSSHRIESLKEEIKELRKRFPGIRNQILCSTLSNTDMIQLKEMLGAIAYELLSVRPPVPERYLTLEKLAIEKGKLLIRNKELPVITWESFLTLDRENGESVMDEEEKKNAASMLSDFGSILYFREVSSLHDIVILDPQVLASLFTNFISTRSTFIQRGVLDIARLPHILRDYKPSLYPHILSLCTQFKVITPIPSQEGKYLVCSLLPEERPSILPTIWPSTFLPLEASYEAGRRFDISFMPPGLYSHFLSQIVGIGITEVIWHYGFVLQFDSSTVMSQVNYLFLWFNSMNIYFNIYFHY